MTATDPFRRGAKPCLAAILIAGLLGGCIGPGDADPPEALWYVGMEIPDEWPEPGAYAEPPGDLSHWHAALDATRAHLAELYECVPDEGETGAASLLIEIRRAARSSCRPDHAAQRAVALEMNASSNFSSLEELMRVTDAEAELVGALLDSPQILTSVATVQVVADRMAGVQQSETWVLPAMRGHAQAGVEGDLEKLTAAIGFYEERRIALTATRMLLESVPEGLPCQWGGTDIESAVNSELQRFETAYLENASVEHDWDVTRIIDAWKSKAGFASERGWWPLSAFLLEEIRFLHNALSYASSPEWPSYEEAEYLVAKRLSETRSLSTDLRMDVSGPWNYADRWTDGPRGPTYALALHEVEWGFADVDCPRAE